MCSVSGMSIRKDNEEITINMCVCVCNKKSLFKRTNYDTVWGKLRTVGREPEEEAVWVCRAAVG